MSLIDIKNKPLNEILNIIDDNTDISSIFPQCKEDLIKLDDLKRNNFCTLVKWVTKIIKEDLSKIIIDELLFLENNFISLVNMEWGKGIYEHKFQDFKIENNNDEFAIPEEIFYNCSVKSILETPADFFPNCADSNYKKLINIIKVISNFETYLKPEAKNYLNILIKLIKDKVQKYKLENIRSELDDHSWESIIKSSEYYKPWIKLAQSLNYI